MDMEVINEVERGWRLFGARWIEAAAAGALSRHVVEAQRGNYYAATRHALLMVNQAAVEESRRSEDSGDFAERLRGRLEMMVAMIATENTLAAMGRQARIEPAIGRSRWKRLARAVIGACTAYALVFGAWR